MGRGWLVFLVGLGACQKAKDSGDKKPGSIVEDTAPYDTGMDFLLDDTGTKLTDTGPDPYSGQDPRNNLTLEYSGFFDFGDGAFPNYTTVSGEIHVVESLDAAVFDGENKCYWIFKVSGTSVPTTGCSDCDFAMETTYVYDAVPRDLDHNKLEIGTDSEFETAMGECEDYDLPPVDGATWTLGFSSNTAYLDYGNSGFWVPWYTIHEDAFTNDRFLMDPEDNHYEYGFYFEYDTADSATN